MERNLPSADFRQIQGDDVKHLECLRAIRDYGFVIIEGAPAEPGFIRDLAAIVGNVGAGSAYGEIFDLTPSSSVRTMGNTFRPVPPHTDEAFRHAPPGLNILGCLRPASAGGESILVDGFHVGEMLRQEDADGFRLLSGLPHGYHRRHDGKIDQISRGTIFSLDEDGRMAGVRIHTRASAPLDLPAALVPDYYRAYRRLCQLLVLRPNQMRHTLGAGDAIVFDNHRVLHARGEFDDPRRHLQICNVTRDSFHERLRLVALRLGYSEEAALRLGGGATTM